MDYGYPGNSWWSKKWLDTLLHGTQSETINTALRYFGRSQLTSLEITDNRIISHVRGPNGGFHDNYIVFPKVPKEKTDVLVGLLKQQPTELRALANDTLSPSLELLLAKCGITLFDPVENVKTGCDCKDPQPCKYIVTTFLGIAKEMVDNPFMLFKIHGMDIEFLKDFKAEETQSMEAPFESALIRGIDKLPSDKLAEENANGRIPEINFDEWHNYSRILPAMLQNFPDFCPAGNFRKSFADEMEFCRKYYSEFDTFYDFAEQFRLYHNKTFMMEGESLQLVHSDGWKWHFIQAKDGQVISSDLSVETAMGALCALSRGNFFMHHVTVRFLHRALMAAFHLIKTGAIYPQVFWIGKDVAQMRWLPAEMLPDILAIVAEFEKFAPASVALVDKDEDRQLLASPAEHVLSIFISQLLRFARKFKPQNQKGKHENLLAFFFNCISGKLANNAHAIPGKIQQWFSVYSSLDFRAQLLFACSEIGNEIALDVFVLSENVTDASRTPLCQLYENNDSRLLSIISILNGIAESFKPMEKYLENKAQGSIIMHGADLLEFLQNSLKKLEVLGIQTELPKSLMNVARPKTQMRVQGSLSYGAFKAQDLLDFDWEVAIGDEKISATEFLKLAEQAEGLLKYKSQYIRVTDDDLQKLREKVEKKAAGESEEEITQAKLVQACLTGKCESEEGENLSVTLTDQMKSQMEAWRGESEIDLPTGLNATLRPYQLRGYSWMYKNLDMGFGCILADDMGLGKTLQVITYLLKIKQEGKLNENKALVVLPAGLLCNWQMEIKKFAPELTFMPYHGGSRDLQKFNADVLLTTYATFRKDVDKLKERQWQAVIIDEAQNIKNADSDQSRLLRSMQAPMKIAMSGTPVENRLLEFWTIMDFCNRGILPNATEFHNRFEIPIQKNGSQPVAEQFRKITAPFMLRRLKTDKSIISDLPDKIIQDEYAELTKSQAVLYKTTLDKFMADLELEEMMREQAAATAGLGDKTSGGAGNSSFKRKGIILQMILALKQICNHPATYLKIGHNPSAATSEEGANDESATNVPVLESGKLQMLIDLLKSIQEQGEKAIIFTQFTEMGKLLQSSIESELGIRPDFYHGGCTQSQRNNMVKNFQENPESKILILSLKAAGTGLNLTAASQVIHYDLWWNPAIEAQATDRAFRIGQTRNVQVHRFITKGTFEEKINALLDSKKAIAELTVNAGETWIADLSDADLGEVFGLDNSIV